jgi:hypothetical protein
MADRDIENITDQAEPVTVYGKARGTISIGNPADNENKEKD